jgi:hypothetical protein
MNVLLSQYDSSEQRERIVAMRAIARILAASLQPYVTDTLRAASCSRTQVSHSLDGGA